MHTTSKAIQGDLELYWLVFLRSDDTIMRYIWSLNEAVKTGTEYRLKYCTANTRTHKIDVMCWVSDLSCRHFPENSLYCLTTEINR